MRRGTLYSFVFLSVTWQIAGLAHAQTMTEFGAATAGSVVGGASGKSVSDGINSIFGKLNQQTVRAAGTDPAPKKETSALTVAPGVARDVDTMVPAPPSAGHAKAKPAPALPIATKFDPPVPFAPASLADALPSPPLPPPPSMTPESLKRVTIGMHRAELLRLGDPSSRVSMFDDGHLVETFSYRADGQRFGRIEVQDGIVAKVEAK